MTTIAERRQSGRTGRALERPASRERKIAADLFGAIFACMGFVGALLRSAAVSKEHVIHIQLVEQGIPAQIYKGGARAYGADAGNGVRIQE